MKALPGLVAAVRIARRDALRHRGRSLLVLLMVALPVLGLTAADVLARTMQLSPLEKLDREIGSADAMLQIVGGHVTQQADPARGMESTGSVEPGTPAYAAAERRARAALPAGSRVIEFRRAGATVRASGRAARVSTVELDLRDPMTRGISLLRSGRVPRTRGEVAVSPHLASRLGVRVGGRIAVGGEPETVTGVVANPSGLADDDLWALPGTVPEATGAMPYLLVTSPRPLTWNDVRRLDAVGVATTSRYVVAHAPPADSSLPTSGSSGPAPATVGAATVAVGLAVLEVVLLAGAAFAVGARRQRRELALISAAGADAADVRRIVVAGGAVLGAAGAVLGVAAGVAVGLTTLAPVQRLADRLPGHVDVRPVELLGIAAVGCATGLLAAVLPARAAARDDVVAALTGRRGIVSTRSRAPVAGLSMVGLGALVAGYAAHPPARFTLVLAGAIVSELGFVVCSPALVGLVGRAARHLPLGPRLALRDAARHRARTGPAVAAIMAAIAGSVAVSTYIVSTVARERQQYQPQALLGQTVLYVHDDPSDLAATLATARRDLGGGATVGVATADCVSARCTTATVRPAAGSTCGGQAAGCGLGDVTVAVGDARAVRAIAGHDDAGAAAALARGAAVVFWDGLVRDGRLRIHVDTADGSHGSDRELPAYVVRPLAGEPLAPALLPTATARAMGLRPVVHDYVVETSRTPTQAQVDRANADVGDLATAYVEHGYRPERWAYGLVALAIGAAIVTLGATAVTTGLSAAENRPDLATLAAVGAAPRTRRALAGSQAGTVTTLGAVLGVVAGVIPAWAILTANGGMPFVLPWPTIGALVVGLPVLTTLATAAASRASVAAERRPG